MIVKHFKEFSKHVGNTPLMKLECEETKNLSIYAKCEWHNPTGSIKDRAALGMINKYLQEADKKQNILEYNVSSNKKNYKNAPNYFYKRNQLLYQKSKFY